jgi:indoleamine 2,3-dioxygenase
MRGADLSAALYAITGELNKIRDALDAMKAHLLVLKKDCQPAHFYWELRPWIAGSGPQGWTYQLQGNGEVTLKLGGSTAGSSSLLQALDSFLGIEFGESHIEFRRTMQEYMPRRHREFVQVLENLQVEDVMAPELRQCIELENSQSASARSPLRYFVLGACEAGLEGAVQLGEAYNEVLRGLKAFRDEHFRIVSLFIINQASKPRHGAEKSSEPGVKAPLQGTGGSDLAKLLKGYRDSSQKAMLRVE